VSEPNLPPSCQVSQIPPELFDGIRRCAQQLQLYPHEALRIKQEWHAEMTQLYGRPGADLAFYILTIGQERNTLKIDIGHLEVDMSKNKNASGNYTDASQQAGRDMTGVSGGVGNKEVTLGDVTVYNNTVDQSFSTNPELRDALKQGADAIRNHNFANPAVKESVLDSYGKLTAELQQTKPDAGMLQFLWGGIKNTVGTLKPIVELGLLLGKVFGVTL